MPTQATTNDATCPHCGEQYVSRDGTPDPLAAAFCCLESD